MQLTPFDLYTLEKDLLKEKEKDRDWDLEKWKATETAHNRRTARLLAAIYNNNPNRKKNAKMLTEDDFMPKVREKVKPMNADQLKDKMLYIQKTINAANKASKEEG